MGFKKPRGAESVVRALARIDRHGVRHTLSNLLDPTVPTTPAHWITYGYIPPRARRFQGSVARWRTEWLNALDEARRMGWIQIGNLTRWRQCMTLLKNIKPPDDPKWDYYTRNGEITPYQVWMDCIEACWVDAWEALHLIYLTKEGIVEAYRLGYMRPVAHLERQFVTAKSRHAPKRTPVSELMSHDWRPREAIPEDDYAL